MQNRRLGSSWIARTSATICTPRTPGCTDCPVAEWCEDPSVYQPPPKQGTFNGSRREARGAVLKALVKAGTAATADIVQSDALDAELIDEALAALHREGMIHSRNGLWSLAEG